MSTRPQTPEKEAGRETSVETVPNEERMRAFLLASADVIFRVSGDWSEMLDLRGLDCVAETSQPDRKWLQKYICPGDQARVLTAIKAAISGRTVFELEHRVIQWDGSLGWMSSRAVPFFDRHGQIEEWFGAASDITERKLTEEALRLSESRKTTLLELSDRWRELNSPQEVAYAAAEVLGQLLEVSRCGYGTIDLEAETITIERDWNAPGIRGLSGILHFRDYGSYIEDLKRGQTVVFSDATKDPRTKSNAAALEAISALAIVNLPVSEQGGVVALLYLNNATPRLWTDEELALIREVAERTRVAVERRRVEETLRTTKASLDFALQSAQVGDWDLDLVNDTMRRSRRHDQCFGYPEGVPGGEWNVGVFLRHVHPDDLPFVKAQFERVEKDLQDCHFECRVLWPDESVHWIAVHGSVYEERNGRPTRMLGIVADITARKQAEESLHHARDRFDLVREAAEVGFWFCDLPFNELLWDARVKEHFWLPADARVTIDTFYERIHPDDRETTRRSIAEAIESRARYDIEYRTVSQDGREKWIRAVGRAFYGQDGQPIRFDGITHDVTLRIRNEERLRQSIEQAERSRQEAEAASRAKDDFLAALSHELRTPLNPVLMLASEMAADESLSPEVRDDLRMIQRNIGLEARLIDDLLDLTRISRGKLQIQQQRTEVHALLRQCEEIVRSDLAGRTLDLSLLLDARNSHVLADPARLQQVFWNILKNAVKFTPDGGRIAVQTSNPGNGRLRVRFEDTGRGIARDALDRIFNAFDQGNLNGRHAFGGLGLGLSISKAIVALHNGSLQAASPGVGLGSTFTVELAAVD